jgi:putative transposase
MLPHLLDGLKVPRTGRGRPRTTPDALLADKAYCSRSHRKLLQARGVKVVIPQRADQIRNRAALGSRGGRPPGLDTTLYKQRNVVERSYCTLKQWRGLATRYDKHAINYRGAVILNSILVWLDALIGDMP